MTDGFLEERRRALEESFFHKRNADLMQQLKVDLEREAKRKKLATVSGIVDETLLNRFIDLKMEANTVAALALVPLVRVAWADGKLEPASWMSFSKPPSMPALRRAVPASAACKRGWIKSPTTS